MTQRVAYQDKYSWGMQSNITDAVDCSNGILFNEHPSFDPGQRLIYTRKNFGSASLNPDLIKEVLLGKQIPNANGSVLVTSESIYMPLKTLFQKGSLQLSSAPTIKWFFPYSKEDSLCESWTTLVRALDSAGTSKSHVLIGGICDSLQFSISGHYLEAAYSILAREFGDDRDITNDSFTISNYNNFLWTNATVKVGNGYTALEDLDIFSFILHISNGALPRFYNNRLAKKFILGRIRADGSLTVPRSNSSSSFTDNAFIDRLLNEEITRFSIYWGSQYATNENNLSLNFLARCTGASTVGDDELYTDIPIQLVESDYISSKNSIITAWEVDSSDDTKVSFTLTSSVTFSGNIFPGDYVQFEDSVAGSTAFYTIEQVIDNSTVKLTQSHADGIGATGSTATIMCHPINIGVNDGTNRGIT